MKLKEFITTDLWFPNHDRYRVLVKNIRREDGKNDIEIVEETRNPKTKAHESKSFTVVLTDQDVRTLAAGLLESLKDY